MCFVVLFYLFLLLLLLLFDFDIILFLYNGWEWEPLMMNENFSQIVLQKIKLTETQNLPSHYLKYFCNILFFVFTAKQ